MEAIKRRFVHRERLPGCGVSKQAAMVTSLRVSVGLTVNRQMAKKLTVNRQKRNVFTVNREMSEPKLAVKFLRYP